MVVSINKKTEMELLKRNLNNVLKHKGKDFVWNELNKENGYFDGIIGELL